MASLREAGLFSGGKTALTKILKDIGFSYNKFFLYIIFVLIFRSYNKKEEMVAWLQAKGIDANMQMIKPELIKLVKENKAANVRFEIDVLALEYGHRVLRIPPYHCQYNAIELIWAQIKGYAARHNISPPFSTKNMMTLLKEACGEVTRDDWAKVVEKTKNLIFTAWNLRTKNLDLIFNHRQTVV